MKICMITFRSVTPAQRGESLLKRAGIDCALHRTPRWMEEQGCGYSLRLRQEDGLPAAELLRQNQVQFRKIYLRQENGRVEELHV